MRDYKICIRRVYASFFPFNEISIFSQNSVSKWEHFELKYNTSTFIVQSSLHQELFSSALIINNRLFCHSFLRPLFSSSARVQWGSGVHDDWQMFNLHFRLLLSVYFLLETPIKPGYNGCYSVFIAKTPAL